MSGSSDRTRGILRLLLLWAGAYTTLMALFLVFGEQLNPLPLPVRVLIVSAVLVLVMTQIVIPLVARLLSRQRRR